MITHLLSPPANQLSPSSPPSLSSSPSRACPEWAPPEAPPIRPILGCEFTGRAHDAGSGSLESPPKDLPPNWLSDIIANWLEMEYHGYKLSVPKKATSHLDLWGPRIIPPKERSKDDATCLDTKRPYLSGSWPSLQNLGWFCLDNVPGLKKIAQNCSKNYRATPSFSWDAAQMQHV